MDTTVFFIGAVLVGTLQVALIGAYVYGVYLCFNKSWICGLAGLLIAFFAVAVGAAKFVLNHDLLGA